MEYNREFSYKGFRFNIQVHLDFKIERRMNGKRFHKIIINDMGFSNYYKTALITGDELVTTIKVMEQQTKDWVDSQNKGKDYLSPHELDLIKLGFKS